MSKKDDASQSSNKDIIKELKDAAALIDAVREISKDVDENTVLNGGGNETQITVETTLEGDLVDRAIESVQRKADNIKKLITTLIPVFLLFTGGSLEAFGVIDIFSDNDEIPDSRECNYGIDWVDWTWEDDELNVFGGLWTNCNIDSSDSLDNMIVMANAFDAESPNQEWVLGNIDLFNWYQDSNFHIELGDAPDREIDIWVDLFIQKEFDNGGTPIAQEQLVGIKKPVEIIGGCTDPSATNYDSSATDDDGSCEYEEEKIYGCTDPSATNYNSDATDDDGSCEYETVNCDENNNTGVTNSEVELIAFDADDDGIEEKNDLAIRIVVFHRDRGCEAWVEFSVDLYLEDEWNRSMPYTQSDIYYVDEDYVEYYVFFDYDLDNGKWGSLVKIRDADTLEEYETQIHTNTVRIME